ncbi:MAG: LPS export ABC transporter permease LptG [Candidatus Omnitrophota bacterium]
MRIIDRYLTKGFVSTIIWCVFAFTFIGIIADIFSFIERIVKHKIPAESIAAFYVYYTPSMLIQVIPISVLLSTIYLLGNLNKNNEIIAMRAAGISLWRVIAPLLLVGLILSASIFILNDRIVPASSRIAQVIRKEELEKHKRRPGSNLVIHNVAVYGMGNKIIFARSYDVKAMTLKDVIIHAHDRGLSLISKTTAKEGAWNGSGWIFSDVITYTVNNSGKILGEPQFSESRPIDIFERPSDFAKREWKPEFMSLSELISYIENFKGSGVKLLRNLEVEFHNKISSAFISLIIILVASPFALITTRGGVIVGISIGIALGLFYYGTIAVCLALGKSGVLPPVVAAWLSHVIFAILGIYLINKRG